MKMNQINFVSASKEVAVDLALLLSSYQEIKIDDASTRDEIELLDGQFGEILSRMNDIINFAGQARHTADMITDTLGTGLQLTSEIMKEKARIIKICTALTTPYNIDDYVSLN